MTEPLRVLVIEDEVLIAQVIVDVLEAEGYEVRRAANGREGLDALGRWLPDLIILDLMMPIMDGRAFRSEQRRLDGGRAEVPVVVLSGAHEARAIADELGAAVALTKPFDIDNLLAELVRFRPDQHRR